MINTTNKEEDMSDENENPGTSIEIGGIKFTGGKIFAVLTALSTAAGGVWGGAFIYRDYMDMKAQIENYVTPDLSGIEQRVAVAQENVDKTVQYSQDIKNDLKDDLRTLEGVVEDLERSNREFQRDVTQDVKDMRKEVEITIREVRRYSDETVKEVNDNINRIDKETTSRIKTVQKDLENKLQKALDNPLNIQ